MPERVKVYELAKELGTSKLNVVWALQEMGFHIVSASAQLTGRQATAARRHFTAASTAPAWRARAFAAAQRTDQPTDLAWATCPCCELKFSYLRGEVDSRVVAGCPPCQPHLELADENDERMLARALEHESRLRFAFEYASKSASENEARMKQAYRSRQKWKAALAEVVLAHHPSKGRCKCGAEKYPCLTVRRLEQANRGIARAVEQLAMLSDRELERELYPDEPWRQVDLEADDLGGPSTAA